MRFVNGKIYRNGEFSIGELAVSDGVICTSTDLDKKVIDAQGYYIVPGLIDLQLNGAFGCDFTIEPKRVAEVSKELGRFGVTAFLATLLLSSPLTYKNNLPELQKLIGYCPGAELLGVHLEGPCFNLYETKAHPVDAICSCSRFATPEECYGEMKGVKIVTLAPEIDGAPQWITWLKKRGILVSAGHSRATAVEMERAIDEGVSMATHLFNGMGNFHHRASGITGAVLARPGFHYSLIADGVHLDSRVVKIAWMAQSKGLILVSDAMAAAGMPDGEYVLGERQVKVADGVARIKGEDTLAGCAQGLGICLARFCAMTGASLEEAIPCVTERPARLLNIYPKKGSLEVGSDADITLLDHNLQVIGCYAKGQRIF